MTSWFYENDGGSVCVCPAARPCACVFVCEGSVLAGRPCFVRMLPVRIVEAALVN